MPEPIPYTTLQAAAEVADAVRRLYGTAPPRDAGILHPTAVWQPEGGRLRTLRITPQTPASDMDRFLLDVARARADGILTTGRILREEPTLTLAYRSPSGPAVALAAWREEMLGRRAAPVGMILTRYGEIDLNHPSLASGHRMVAFTTRAGAARLLPEAREVGLDVVSHDAPTVALALDYFRGELGARTISIEAGPSTSRSLYAPRPAVAELLLTTFEGRSVPATVIGPPFLDTETIARLFGVAGPEVMIEEASGPWRFQRYLT